MPGLRIFEPMREFNETSDACKFEGHWMFLPEKQAIFKVLDKYDLDKCALSFEEATIEEDINLDDDAMADLLKYQFIKKKIGIYDFYQLDYGRCLLVHGNSFNEFHSKVEKYFKTRTQQLEGIYNHPESSNNYI